jgi:hypothetical protein
VHPDLSAHECGAPPPRPRSDGHTFVCYAREDSDFVRPLTTYLRDRGIPMWLDSDIPAGADWDAAIDEHLRTCAKLLIVLSPAAVASAEVRGELRAALSLAKPVVPLLYHPCDIPRQLQNVQYLDFSSANDADAPRDALAAVLQSRPLEQELHGHPPKRLAGRDLRNRQEFLDDVKTEAAERLAQSLHAGMLNIPKEKQPQQVTRRWDAEVKIPHQQPTRLEPDTRIVQLFDDPAVGGKLLILGAPGAGKTTALLELGQELIARAEQDADEPMPAFCSLSSWREDGHGLAVWLVDHLKTKYGVRKDHGDAWLNDRLLAPLLDGLDEAAPEQQEACVQAINRFQQDFRPRHLVVCCRLAEYENYRTKLQLNGAVRLLPLADDQIHQYLARGEFSALWQGVSGDPDTMELARSPLLLGMITVAYEETSPEEWQRLATASERQTHLFDVYIRRVLSDGRTAPRYSKAQTVDWLTSLATAMKEHGQPELLIEHLQPTWLRSTTQRLVYRLGVLVTIAAAFVLAQSLIAWLFGRFPRGAVGREYLNALARLGGIAAWAQHDFPLVIVMGLSAGLIVALRKTIKPIETLVWSWTKGWDGMATGLRTMSLDGLNYLAYIGMVVGLSGGVASVWGPLSGATPSPEFARLNAAGYMGAAVAMLSLAGAILLALRPRRWLVGGTGEHGPAVDAIVSGLIFGVAASPFVQLPSAAAAGVSLGLIVRFTGASTLLSAARFADALVIGLVSGLGSGAIVWSTQSVKTDFIDTVFVWIFGGVSVAATAALLAGMVGWFKNRGAAVHPGIERTRRRIESAAVGGVIAAVCGLGIVVARHTGNLPLLRGIAVMSVSLGVGWVGGLVFALLAATIAGVCGMISAAVLGALLGVLKGLTGPDVERRTEPNQGIRQSAANVGICALVGVLIVGIPYGLMNLMIGVAATRTAPGALDFLHFAVAPAVGLGSIGGLVPGAACIQHFTLRAVLWCFGLAPLRAVQFLNYATERMLLQRVGGRYRFIHDLLREHFSAMHPTSVSTRNA